jgi:23S rRNA pseudouridine1911/1915/1917 synthase
LQKIKLRVDAFLAARLPDVSRSRLKDCIAGGQVRVNNAPARKAAAALRLGDAVACEVPAPRATTAQPEAVTLDIVHEDAAVIVINKPAGAHSTWMWPAADVCWHGHEPLCMLKG